MDEEINPMEDSSDQEFVCGDPKVDIRVGDEYQAEIPPMISESKRASLLSNPPALDLNSCSYLVGLPVEVMWVETKSRDSDEDNVDLNESLKSLKTKRNRRGESDANHPRGSKKQRMHLLEALPEKASSSWEDFEVDGFVLGLYTFGKNFTEMKKLLESKGTRDILSFYYGKFYKSAKHKIWSNSLKKRSRKCIQGKKLYSGWRLQLLLSRLIPKITDESKKQKLVNVSKSFAEENTSLEKYITDVKELVGLRFLVEAVAIGKEKEDLTVLTTEPVKSKQWFTVSSSSTTKVAAAGLGPYSSLTSDDIIKKLSGGSRLSKARCNDIFWEAVWPRLLARGWHSEQPKDRVYVKSKDHNLVFLIPGVKKFSGRKLVKQNHYFDSISDILNKIVSEPELLEFETEEIKAPNGSTEEDKVQEKRYLKSPGASSSTHMKFTVVDTTSLATGGKLCEFRKLKHPNPKSKDDSSVEDLQTVPLDSQKRGKFGGGIKWEGRRMKKEVDEPMRFMIVDTSMGHGGLKRRRYFPGGDSTKNHSGADSGVKEEENVRQGFRSKKRFLRQSESNNNHHSVSSLHLPKRKRLSACVRNEIRRSGENSVSKPPALDQTAKLSVDSMTDQLEDTGNGVEEKPEIESNGLSPISEQQQHQEEEKSDRLGSMSDLDKKRSSKNLETAQQQEELIKLPSVSGGSGKNPPTAAQEEEQNQETNNTEAPRRQSTRKRPLTTRAMEALESGFYTAKSMKTTSSKPRKRERSARIKQSANAENKTQGESDNGFLVEEATASKPLDRIEDPEPSFLVNKATTAVDQAQDSKKVTTTDFPKIPPIVLKLSSKRG